MNTVKIILFSLFAFAFSINNALAGTYYFIGSNATVSPAAKQLEIERIANWYDSSTGLFLTTGTALDTNSTWHLSKTGTLAVDLTAKGIVYLDTLVSLSIENNRKLFITGTFYNYGTLQLVGNGQQQIVVQQTGALINYNTLNINSGTLIVYGNLTNTATATISVGATMTINSGGTLTNSGSITNNGTLTVSSGATFAKTGTISGSSSIAVPALVVSTNMSVPNGATYSGISFSSSATLTAQGNLTTTTLNMTNGSIVLGDTLTVSSTISGLSASNTISSDGSASLNFTDTSSGTIYVNQTTSGTSNSFNSITLNTTGTITLANATQVDGVVTPTAGTLVTGGNLILTSSGTTSYGQIAPGTTGTISGNITMEMTAADTVAGWRPIGLPLTSTIDSLNGIDKLYSNHSIANQRNVYYWDATQNGTSGNNTGWTEAASTDNHTKAYLIYSNNNSGGLHDFTGKVSLEGTNKTGNQIFGLNNFFDPAEPSDTSAKGWNFIPNPYPSNIDVTALLASSGFTPGYKAIHVYDYSTSQYTVYCQNGVTVVPYRNNGVSSSIKNIPPFAGIWVKALNNGDTLTFTDAVRTTSMTNVVTLLKKQFDLLRLDVFDANEKWDQTVIYLNDEATAGFDNLGDAYKKDGMNGAPSLSSLIENTRASINALPTGFDTYSIPLSYKSETKGQTRLKLNTSDLGSEWTVELEDKLLGKIHNLKDGDYVFNHDASSDLRFVIHLKRNPATGINLIPEVASFRLFQDFENIQIDAGVHTSPIQVAVYGINGQLLESKTIEGNGIHKLELASLQQSGVYIIQASINGESQQIKVVR